ncbi:unnamed protein product [Echinostoma caproni]|uniref:COMM domain-containing protein n=1 Tax=Echinostoma caproni TaxID=27848 RepID=A0A183ATD7_9TREM|nr:unnamed protein product [Echinostoma caproni]
MFIVHPRFLKYAVRAEHNRGLRPIAAFHVMNTIFIRLLDSAMPLAMHAPITSHLQHLIVQCSSNVGDMKASSVKLQVNGDNVFKRRVLLYSQPEGVLKALQKMEQDCV